MTEKRKAAYGSVFNNRLIGFGLFSLACAVYLNTLGNDFIWDDFFFILGRPEIQSLDNIGDFFLNGVRGLYRPLRTVAYALAWQAFGENPAGWHLVGLVLHGLTTLLFFLIAKHLAGSRAAIIAALLFAVHPVHTERISFATGAMDLVGIVFLLGAIYLALRAGLGSGKISLPKMVLMLVAATVALLSSEEAILLPVYLAAYAVYRSRQAGKKSLRVDWRIIGSTIAVLGCYFILRTNVIGAIGRGEIGSFNEWGTVILAMGQVFLRYFQLLVLPTGLRVEYDMPLPTTWQEPSVLLGWGLVAALGLLALVLLKEGKLSGLALAWMLLALLPFSNIIPGSELIAERYLYVPSMGYCLLIGLLVAAPGESRIVKGKTIQYGLYGAVLILVVVFGMQTFLRNRLFADDCLLFADTLRHTPTSSHAHNNLAACLSEDGQVKEAEHHFREALKLDPGNFRARYNLANLLVRRGDFYEAGLIYKNVEPGPATPDQYRFFYGLLLALNDDPPPSDRWLADPVFLVGRGFGWQHVGRYKEAEAVLKEALESGSLTERYRSMAELTLGYLGEQPGVDRTDPDR